MTFFKLYNKVKFTCLVVILISFTTSTYGQAPTITTISPLSVCPNATITIEGTNLSGITNVKITNGGDLTFVEVSSTKITAILPATITNNSFTIDVTNGMGSVTSSTISKYTGASTGPTTLQTPTVTGTLTVCENQPLNLSIDDPDNNAGVVFSWTFSTSSSIRRVSNRQPKTIEDILSIDDNSDSATVTYSVKSTYTSTCGVIIESPVTTVDVIVNVISAVTLPPQTPTVCSTENLNISFNVLNASGDPTWALKNTVPDITLSEASGTGNVSITVTNTSNTSKSFTLVVTPPAGTAGCKGNAKDLLVIVRPKHTRTALKPPLITGELNICTGSNLDLVISDPDSTPGVVFSWTANGTDITGISSNTGTKIEDGLTYSGSNTVGTVTYTITSTLANPCGGMDDTNSTTVDVQVYAIPNPLTPAVTGPVCSGNNIQITLNPTAEWRLMQSVTDVVFPDTGTGDINQKVENNSNESKELIFVITPKNGSCMGDEIKVPVTIAPPYTPPPLNIPNVSNAAGDAVTICTGETLNLDITDPDGLTDVVFSWSATATSADITGFSPNSVPKNRIDDTLTYTGTGMGADVTYTVTSTLMNTCDGSSQTKSNTITVTVNKQPTITIPAGDIVVCNNSNLNIDFTSTNTTEIRWSLKKTVTGLTLGKTTGTGNVNTIVQYSGSTDTTFTIVATTKNGACVANALEVNVDLLAPITLGEPTVVGSVSICSGDALNLQISDNDHPTATFSWTTNKPTNVSGFNDNTDNTRTSIKDALILHAGQSSATVEYTITATLKNPCGGSDLTSTKIVSVVVNQKPSVAVPTNAITVASGGTLALSFDLTPNTASVKWKLKNNPVSGISLRNPMGDGNLDSGDGNLSVTVTNTNEGDTPIIIVVTPSIGGCEGTAVEKTVTIEAPLTGPVLDEPVVEGVTEICSGSALALTLVDPNNNPDVTFSWTATSSNVTGFSSSGTTNTITDTLMITGTTEGTVEYTITATLINGTNTQTEVVTSRVKVFPLPTMNVPAATTVCSGENISLTFNNLPANVEARWMLKPPVPTDVVFAPDTMGTGNIDQEVTNNSTTSKQLIFVITPFNTTTKCSGISKEVKVNVIPPLQEPTITGSLQVCDGDPLALQLSDINAQTTFSWVVIESINVSGASDSNGTTSTTISDILSLEAGSTTGSVKYRITSLLDGVCASQQMKSKEIEVIVNSKPTISNVPAETFICGSSIKFNFTLTAQNTKVEWKVERQNPKINLTKSKGEGNIDIGYNTPVQLTDIESIFFSARAVTINGGACSSGVSTFFVIKIVPPVPPLSTRDITGSLEVCSNTRTNLVISSSNKNVTYSWKVDSSNGVNVISSSNSGTVIADQLNRTSDTGDATVTYAVTPNIGECTGPTKEITVKVISPPVISFSPVSTTTVVNGEANICVNTGLDVKFVSSASTGINYKWSITNNTSNIEGIIYISGTTNIIEENSISHSISEVQTIIYSIEASKSGCTGVPITLKVNVHPIATIGFENFKRTVCSGEQLSFSARVANGLNDWSIKIESIRVLGSTVSGQNQSDNFTGTVGDVLVNTTTASQTVKYKITASDQNSPCNDIVVTKEITVLPQANFEFEFESPHRVCPGNDKFYLKIKSLVNINASTLEWINTDPLLLGGDPKLIKDDANGLYYYDVNASEGSLSQTILLRASVKTKQGTCLPVVKDFSFTIEAVPQMTLSNYNSNTLLSNKSDDFILKLHELSDANTTFSVVPSDVYVDGFIKPNVLKKETTVTVTATYTDPTTSCETTKTFNIKVYKAPEPSITNTTASFCADVSELVDLEGSPDVGGNITSAFWSGQGIINPNRPTEAKLNIASLEVGENSITYNVTDENEIENSTTKIFTIHNLPEPANFTAEIKCRSKVQFTDNTISVQNKNNIITDWQWDFGDGTTSTKKNPLHAYTSTGSYTVSLVVSTEKGCQSTIRKNVVIPSSIIPNFEWAGLCESTEIQFTDKSENISNDNTYKWEFGDGTFVEGENNDDNIKNPTHTYTTPGQYNVKLTIGIGDCTVSKTHILTVHTTITPTTSISYSESFERGDGGWVPGFIQGGVRSSWAHGVPTASVINNTPNGASVWTTNKEGDYNVGEQSWITSPCFNLNSLPVPELSFYIFSHTPEKVAGSTFEISYDKGISWQLFGSTTTKNAFNWFDNSAIAGNLFSANSNSNLGREGWSGEFTEWKHVIFDLESEFRDRSVEDKHIVLRLVFASPIGQPARGNGVAIDNVFIGNKKEKILVEHLINLNDVVDRQSELSFNATYSDFLNKIVNINYHVNTFGYDRFNSDNPVPAATRRLYYDLTNEKYIIINGKRINTNLTTVSQIKDEFIQAGFKKQKVTLTTIIKQNTVNNSFDIEVNTQVIENKDFNAFKEGYTLQCIITQPKVIGLPSTENTEDSEYYNVMKEMLPNAGGKNLILNDNGRFNTVNLKYFPRNIYNEKKIEIIIFIQNKESKQIELVDKYTYQNVSNTDFSALAINKYNTNDDIVVYPVPFDNELKISIPPSINDTQSLKIQWISNNGIYYYLPIRHFNENMVVNTSNLPDGVYMLHIYNDNTNYYKKVIKSK